jgi:tRNA threonylcarbamoyladenosine biosynthesis protein TsaB
MLLAIDTATPQVGVALWAGEAAVVTWTLAGGRRHGEVLAPAIDRMVAEAGVSVADLRTIVVDVGPGLFTGLRVGLATAKALVSALGVPAVGVSSLDVLAHMAVGFEGTVAAVVDARRHEVFRALYRLERGVATCVVAAEVVPPDSLARELASWAAEHGPVLAVGDGAVRYASSLEGPGVVVGPTRTAHPDVVVLAALGAAAADAGEVTDAVGLTPRYLRQPDVRIGWAERGSGDPASERQRG